MKTAKRILLIFQLILLSVVAIGCESMIDDDLTHRNESPFDSFIRHSDEEQQRREHPEWQHPEWAQ